MVIAADRALPGVPELAWGADEVLDAGDGAVLAHRADAEGGTVVAVHNFADRKVTATLPLTGLEGRDLYDVLAADGRRSRWATTPRSG